MTRFARAKGSKSSNEKVPEPATPWSELKNGMLKKQKPAQPVVDVVSVLESQTQQGKSSKWADLDNNADDPLNILKSHLAERRENRTLNLRENLSGEENSKMKRKLICDSKNANEKAKKKKSEITDNGSFISAEKTTVSMKEGKGVKKLDKDVRNKGSTNSMDIVKRKKRKKPLTSEKTKAQTADVANQNEINAAAKKKKMKISGPTKNMNISKQGSCNVKIKERDQSTRQKNIGQTPLASKKDQPMVSVGKDDSLLPEKTGSEDSSKKMKNFAVGKSANPIQKSNKAGKNKKIQNDKKFVNYNKREKYYKESGGGSSAAISINGETVNVVKFQGFYIKEDDAQRLKELKKKMIEEGIPEDRIKGAIQLERRRCEKALARMKKNVCFHCRKPGHVLSECPENARSVDTGTGVCYKCGSTEHTAFSCQVSRGRGYPFAECFICGERGHIARECPDNPRGLYPNGGCCKLCGSVTHLKKDCPEGIVTNEEHVVRLGLLDDKNLEGLDDRNFKSQANANAKGKSKKPVTF